jgi:hypothetical protein
MQLHLGQIAIAVPQSGKPSFRGVRWHVFSNRLGLPTTLIQDLRFLVVSNVRDAWPSVN